MTFVDRFKQLNWDDIGMSIFSKTAADVERALSKPKRDLEDFKALISPAAEPYLEQMAQQSLALTRKRFGNTMSLYIPLYLSHHLSQTVRVLPHPKHNHQVGFLTQPTYS